MNAHSQKSIPQLLAEGKELQAEIVRRVRAMNAPHIPHGDSVSARRFKKALKDIAYPGFDPEYPLCCNVCDGSRRWKKLSVESIKHEDWCPVGIAQRALAEEK